MQENENTNVPRITIGDARTALGMVERNYSDRQIERMIEIAMGAAEFAFEEFQRQENDEGGD